MAANRLVTARGNARLPTGPTTTRFARTSSTPSPKTSARALSIVALFSFRPIVTSRKSAGPFIVRLAITSGLSSTVAPAITSDDGSTPRRPSVSAAFEWGRFVGSVVLLLGSGQPVSVHPILAFNAYLNRECARHGRGAGGGCGLPSRESFKKFWAELKTRVGNPLPSVPSPYKWEKKGVKDVVGVFSPEFVTELVVRTIEDVWGAIMAEWDEVWAGHFVRCNGSGKRVSLLCVCFGGDHCGE
ncbi:hypothetical protein VTI74DRAFT_1400 [Chaetomium olivicolor]